VFRATSFLEKTPQLKHNHAMMLRFFVLGGLLLFCFASPAAHLKLDVLKVGPKTYRNVTVLGVNATDLYVTHAHGIANVKLKYLDANLQKQFHYDAQAAAEAERQQAQEDSTYQLSVESDLVAQAQTAALAAQKAALAARKAAATSEDSLADPVSDQSLLGKPVPAIEADKWLGQKPVLKEKFVLITFWAPWSIPCRNCIPELNALQKKFPDKLVVVGVTSESEEDVEQMAGPRMEFSCAIDSQAKLSAAAGVTSIPCVLLVDAKGIVRYQGHPAAIDEKKLQSLLAKASE